MTINVVMIKKETPIIKEHSHLTKLCELYNFIPQEPDTFPT